MSGLLNRSARCLKRHSPTILSFLGAAGVIFTSVMVAKATPKAVKLLKGATDKKGEELTKLEVVKVAAPFYIPAAAIGLSTIGCILSANALNKRNQASLASAYALLAESFKRYKAAANTMFGEDADSQIQAEIAKTMYISVAGEYLYDASTDESSDNVLFYDAYSCRFFETTWPAVIQAQYHINRNFSIQGFASLNEFYRFLGIDKIEGGDDIGWGDEFLETFDGAAWLDFRNDRVHMEGGLECVVISALFEPTSLYSPQ